MIRDYPKFDTSPCPRPQWYYEDGKQWKSYYDLSNLIEKAYQQNNKGNFNLPNQSFINFQLLKEQNSNGYLQQFVGMGRCVLRATWFWQENDKTWFPYSSKINDDLETEYSKGFPNELCIGLNPPRVIKPLQNNIFVQIRKTTNGKPEGRAVTRGFPGEGMTLERLTLKSECLRDTERKTLYMEEIKTCWMDFCTSHQLESTTTEPPQIDFYKYCKGLGIWGYNINPQDPWLRDDFSPLANWLYGTYQKDNKNITVKSFFDIIYIETQGSPEQCHKFAYRRILEFYTPTSIIHSLENAFIILKDVLQSIGLSGKRRGLRGETAVEFALKFAKEITLDESTYHTSSFLDDLLRAYFGTHPPRSRHEVPEHMNPLIPFHRYFNLALTISLGLQLAVDKADQTYLDRSNDRIWPCDCGEMVQMILPSIPGDLFPYVTFEDYAPQVFRALRLHYGISDDYIASLGIESLLFQLIFCGELNTYRQIGSYGKSGSVFFYSYDFRFLIKTLRPQEAECLRKRLSDYYLYMTKEKTLIVPILGLYSIFNSVDNEKMYFCVMKNLFDKPDHIHEIYDLKGSTYERSTKDRKPGVPLKDLDFGDRQLLLPDSVRTQLMDQIRRDTNFLCHSLLSMDYSLLVGIHNVFCEQKEGERVYGSGIVSLTGERVYYFGIIDYLLEYGLVKLMESALKMPMSITGEISAVDSVKYAARFTESVEKKIWSPVL